MYYLVPLLFHLLCTPIWYLDISMTVWIWLSLFEKFVGILIIPVYLSILSIKKPLFEKTFFQVCILILLCCVGPFIEYLNWGISTGWFFTPDSETVLIIKMEILISIIISCVLYFVLKK